MSNPFTTEKRERLRLAARNTTFRTAFEMAGQTKCCNCKKRLVRCVDIDTMCDPCWDYCLMPPDEGPIGKELQRVAGKYVRRLKRTEKLGKQNDLCR